MLILKDSTLRQLVNSELVFDSRTFLVGVKALESVENYALKIVSLRTTLIVVR